MCGAIITTFMFGDISSTTTNMAYSQVYLVMYQAIKHHHLITPPYTSPYMDTPKMLFWEKKALVKNPWKGGTLSTVGFKRSVFENVF